MLPRTKTFAAVKAASGPFGSAEDTVETGTEFEDPIPEAEDGEPAGNDMIRVAVAVHRQRGELIHMLMDAIRLLSSPGPETLERLEGLERELTGAVDLDDLRKVKPKLAACLEEVCRESRQRESADETAKPAIPAKDHVRNRLLARFGKKTAEEPQVQTLDPVTGLPQRHAAENALEQALRSKRPISPAVIVIDSLPAINMRFGRETGDALLQAFGDFVAQTLSPEDELFRWTGPAFVALLRHPIKDERGASEFTRLMEQKFEHTIRTGSRNIHLSPAKRWTVLVVHSKAAEMFQEIDRFVSPAVGRP